MEKQELYNIDITRGPQESQTRTLRIHLSLGAKTEIFECLEKDVLSKCGTALGLLAPDKPKED